MIAVCFASSWKSESFLIEKDRKCYNSNLSWKISFRSHSACKQVIEYKVKTCWVTKAISSPTHRMLTKKMPVSGASLHEASILTREHILRQTAATKDSNSQRLHSGILSRRLVATATVYPADFYLPRTETWRSHQGVHESHRKLDQRHSSAVFVRVFRSRTSVSQHRMPDRACQPADLLRSS